MKDKSLIGELDDQAKQTGAPQPGRSEGTIPGDTREGTPPEDMSTGPSAGEMRGEGPRNSKEAMEADMRAREAALGQQKGSGTLGEGIHVGTPAGGVTEAARTGSAHWGTARESTAGQGDGEGAGEG